jgi:hypothetical protein
VIEEWGEFQTANESDRAIQARMDNGAARFDEIIDDARSVHQRGFGREPDRGRQRERRLFKRQ